MKESVESKLWRWGGNLFPAYRNSGARVTYIASTFREVHIKIPSNWKTRNHMGMIWGGGMYAALDPVFGVMLYKLLGKKYRVIDSAASIRFKRPGKTTLFAKFCLSEKQLLDIKIALQNTSKIKRVYEIDLIDKRGVVHASCEKELSIFAL